MAGLYIHIPFCKKACHYCNFHFSTTLDQKEELLTGLIKELSIQKDFLGNQPLNTIYLGGGTPSILTISELERLFNHIHKHYEVSPGAEWTLEANPDDLSLEKTKGLKSIGVNRLSIGIQSFYEEDLVWMNRSHDAKQAFQCIEDSFSAGIDNFSIDLIFGSPTTTDERWEKNLETACQMHIKHLSCYGLTVEEKTALNHFIASGKMKALDESRATSQFLITMDYLSEKGYDHYEISNYCLPKYEAQHNSNYWKQESYLGIGPSAHSFHKDSRQWNINNNSKYIEALKNNEIPFTKEDLSKYDIYNEYLMTGLRTKWGCEVKKIESMGSDILAHFEAESKILLQDESLILNNGIYTLSPAAKLLADKIISELFKTHGDA